MVYEAARCNVQWKPSGEEKNWLPFDLLTYTSLFVVHRLSCDVYIPGRSCYHYRRAIEEVFQLGRRLLRSLLIWFFLGRSVSVPDCICEFFISVFFIFKLVLRNRDMNPFRDGRSHIHYFATAEGQFQIHY